MATFCAEVKCPALVGAVIAVLFTGCAHKDMPRTYPATGSVVWADGKPVAGGMVDFRQAAASTRSTVGHLQSDGSFTLSTLFGSDKIPGACEGEYEVTVIPASSRHARMAFLLPQKYVVKADQENHFAIKLNTTQPKE